MKPAVAPTETPDSFQTAQADGRSWNTSELYRSALAICAVGAAVLITRLTWPFFTPTPFVPLFVAVYIGAQWAPEPVGLLSIALAAIGATMMAPAGGPPGPQPWMIVVFIGVCFSGNRLVVGRNRAERTLRASERRYRQLFSDNPQAMWV